MNAFSKVIYRTFDIGARPARPYTTPEGVFLYMMDKATGRFVSIEQHLFTEFDDEIIGEGIDLVTVGRFDRMNLLASSEEPQLLHLRQQPPVGDRVGRAEFRAARRPGLGRRSPRLSRLARQRRGGGDRSRGAVRALHRSGERGGGRVHHRAVEQRVPLNVPCSQPFL